MADIKIKRLEERIDALEKRLAALNPADAGCETRLVAPVRIVDHTGQLIAEIAGQTNDNSIKIFNTRGEVVASLGADGTESGYLAIRNKSGKLVGYLDVERFGARLQLISNNENRGGLALFGADASETGGGINITPAADGGGISLWAGQSGGKICIEDADGNELEIEAES